MPEKTKCPERDSNPRHPDLMEGALTTELPRQPQWGELIAELQMKVRCDHRSCNRNFKNGKF